MKNSLGPTICSFVMLCIWVLALQAQGTCNAVADEPLF